MLVALGSLIASWPLLRQLRQGDVLGLGPAVQSPRSAKLKPRIDDADTPEELARLSA